MKKLSTQREKFKLGCELIHSISINMQFNDGFCTNSAVIQ